MSYHYLASPYSSPDPAISAQRALAAQRATAWLLAQRIWVYSPIVHCHELALAHSLPKDFFFWRDYNFAMLERARGLIVLMIDGWRESKGVSAEISYAKELALPISEFELPPP